MKSSPSGFPGWLVGVFATVVVGAGLLFWFVSRRQAANQAVPPSVAATPSKPEPAKPPPPTIVPGQEPTPVPVPPPNRTVAVASEYQKVGFDRLASYTFVPPEADNATPNAAPPSGAAQIPDKIKALDQQKVAVTGFMLPVKMDGSLVKEFLLVKDPMMCCYGVMPKINEWVVVKMVGKGVKPLMDIPITFEGRLRVGEMFENGYLTGLYLLEGDRMAEVKG